MPRYEPDILKLRGRIRFFREKLYWKRIAMVNKADTSGMENFHEGGSITLNRKVGTTQIVDIM